MILGATFVLRETLLRVGRLHSYKNSVHSFLCEIYMNAAICALIAKHTCSQQYFHFTRSLKTNNKDEKITVSQQTELSLLKSLFKTFPEFVSALNLWKSPQ